MNPPVLSKQVCGLCLSTIKKGLGLIRDGIAEKDPEVRARMIDGGINHLDQLIKHIEAWHQALKQEEKDIERIFAGRRTGEPESSDEKGAWQDSGPV